MKKNDLPISSPDAIPPYLLEYSEQLGASFHAMWVKL